MTRNVLERIFFAGIERVDPLRIIRDRVRLDGTKLLVVGQDREHETDLTRFDRMVVLGVGKAAASMSLALEDLLGERIDTGLAVTKYGHGLDLKRVELLQAGHPVPDEAGEDAARRMLALARECGETTLAVMLISGGGSALLPLPASFPVGPRLTLAHKQEATRALLACGADINEINTLRKHLSGIKGGRLLQALAPASCLNLLLSDVMGDDPAAIASGPTVPDPTTYGDGLAVLDKYGVADAMPGPVLELLRLGAEGLVPETLKSETPEAEQADTVLLGSNASALEAAADEATKLGYEVRVRKAPVLGEARVEAAGLADEARRIRKALKPDSRPVCLLSGGEPVVTLRGAGTGGRNQEMALAFLREMQRTPDALAGVRFLAGATDGTDGPTDAAGAFADKKTLAAAREAGLSISAALDANDSHAFYRAAGGLFTTGPTRTNVCDLHVVLVATDRD